MSHSIVLAVFAVGILVGAVSTGIVWALKGSADVRIQVRMDSEGRGEVALQQRDDEGGWGARQYPDARFVPADAEQGRWYSSSVVNLASDVGPADVSGPHQLGPFSYPEALAGTRPIDADTLFCFIAHGTESDSFWRIAFNTASTSARRLGLGLRASIHPESADQANAITECINDGAAVIATTLADPDTLRPALLRAKGTNTRIVTFNSGSEQARSVDSIAHIRLDEHAAGRMAAEAFNERGVSGDILCVIHERVNVGLDERCAALDENYDNGDVIRLNIAVADDPVTVIADALTGDVGAVLTLNYNTALHAVDAAHDRDGVVLGTIGSNQPTLPALIYLGIIQFAIWDQPVHQGHIVPAVMLLVHGLPFGSEGLIRGTRSFVTAPQIVTRADAANLLTEEFAAILPERHRQFIDEVERLRELYGVE